MELIKAQGRLMAIGGGEDKEKDCLILKRFVQLAGDEKASIAVLTTATDLPEEVAAEYTEVFKRLGAKHIEAIEVRQRSDAMKLESVEQVKRVVVLDRGTHTGAKPGRVVSRSAVAREGGG